MNKVKENLDKAKESLNQVKVKAKKGKIVIFIGSIVASLIIILNLAQNIFINIASKKVLGNSTQVEYTEFAKAYSNLLKTVIEKNIIGLDFYLNAQEVKDAKSSQEIVAWLRANEKNRDKNLYDYVAYVDESGTFYSDIGSQVNVKDRDYFQAIMNRGKETYVDNPVASKTTGISVIHICKALKINGRTQGFFCGVVEIQNVKQFINDIDIDNRGIVLVCGDDSSLVAANVDEKQIQNNIKALQQNDLESFNTFSTALKQKKSQNFQIYDGEGKKQVCFVQPVDYTSWSLVLLMDAKKINEVSIFITKYLFIFGAVTVVILIFISGLLLYKSIEPMKVVEKAINGIAIGDADLTKRIEIKSNNEIGRVVDGFNNFAEKLHIIISTMKQTKDELVSAGQLLEDATQDTSAAIAQMVGNIQSMDNQILTQSSSVSQTSEVVGQIAKSIDSLNSMIESQSAAITQASAAVEEMIGNINSVNSSVQKMGKSFEELEEKAISGVQKQNDVNAMISEIENESQMLQEANAVISGIAEQTNLLAMNAAIEAAHAGEAGKGFSVVADEIRKLSEDSSSQSQTIGKQLSKISQSINSIVSASEVASNALSEISGGINSTTNLVMEITNAMHEQNEGSQQILEALNSMNNTSTEVKTASLEMQEKNKSILEEIRNLQDATFSIKDGMAEMSIGTKKINETGTALSDISKQMQISIQKIGSEVDQFKV